MRTEHIRESSSTVLSLTNQQVSALRKLGAELASKKGWWGGDDLASEDRSVVSCLWNGDDKWEVMVRNAIGVISTVDLQLIVEPKIALEHFLHVLRFATSMPRLVPSPAELVKYKSFWNVIVAWFLNALHIAFRGGLIRDYTETTEVLPYVRGRTAYIDAIRRYQRGVLEFDCTFEDFQSDTSLNRVLKAAAQRVVSFGPSSAAARRFVLLLDDVGQLRYGDMRFEIDRRTARYADAFLLAKLILANSGRSLLEGQEKAWTFLIRTPEVIENGIRAILQKHFGQSSVSKEGRKFGALTLNPDLLFSTGNIADIKYKLNKPDWHRPDLYEVVAFATGFGAARAAIINFRTNLDGEPQASFDVGPIKVSNICWDCASFRDPETAESAFVEAIGNWNTFAVT